MQLPIRIKEETSAESLDGTTDNLSAAGVYIRANKAFEIGSKVRFEITLPKLVIGAKRDVQIECEGRVVRTENSDEGREGESGVACVIDQYKFVRS